MPQSQTSSETLPMNLPRLQDLVKKHPYSYEEEVDRQYILYKAAKDIFEQNPTSYDRPLLNIVKFIAEISHCYLNKFDDFPNDVSNLLLNHGSTLHPVMRTHLIKALILMRNKNLISPLILFHLFFKLLRCQDKELRKMLQVAIVNDIKEMNAKSKNMKLNIELQKFMRDMITDNHAVAMKLALDCMAELYKKQVWNDERTVNIIALGCFSKAEKVMVATLKFFVGVDSYEDTFDSDEEEEDEEKEEESKAQLKMELLRKKYKKMKNGRMLKKGSFNTKDDKPEKKKKKTLFDFSAIRLLRDPHSLGERLYKKLTKMNEKFEVKLMLMNFISRLIGIHQLLLPNFYPYTQRYLKVNQKDVTKVMVYAAQASHALVPPSDLEPVVKTLADSFVTERNSSDAMAMGLNAIRELCARNPYCISADLLEDLALYRRHSVKSVAVAANSLVAVFREKNPTLLSKKCHGAPTEFSKEMPFHEYGSNTAIGHIPGAEIVAFSNKMEESSDENDEDDDSQEEDLVDSQNYEEFIKEKNVTKKMVPNREAVKRVLELSHEEREKKSLEVLTSRFLTDNDFVKIDIVQAMKKNKRFRRKKQKLEQQKTNFGEIVTLKNIERIERKSKMDMESKILNKVMRREETKKNKLKNKRVNPFASTSNKEKSKGKHFMMMKHKIRGKQKKSIIEKQKKLRDSLLKFKKRVIK